MDIFDSVDTPQARMALGIGIAVLQTAKDYEERTGTPALTVVVHFKEPLNPDGKQDQRSLVASRTYHSSFEVKVQNNLENPQTK
jgi:hypothetical protein